MASFAEAKGLRDAPANLLTSVPIDTINSTAGPIEVLIGGATISMGGLSLVAFLNTLKRNVKLTPEQAKNLARYIKKFQQMLKTL